MTPGDVLADYAPAVFDRPGTLITEAAWPAPGTNYASTTATETPTVTDVLTHQTTVTDVLRHHTRFSNFWGYAP